MDKDLYRVSAKIIDKVSDGIYLRMGLLQRIVPRHGDMAVYVQGTAILYYPQIMNVYPRIPAMGIEMIYDRIDDPRISFIHDTLQGFAYQL